MKTYAVYLNPMSGIQIKGDLEVVQSILVFRKDGKITAQFTQYMGWQEMEEETKGPGTVLSIVPSGGDNAA